MLSRPYREGVAWAVALGLAGRRSVEVLPSLVAFSRVAVPACVLLQ